MQLEGRAGLGRGRMAAHSVGVSFSAIFIFGTAREPVDCSEPAIAAPAVCKRAGNVQISKASIARGLGGLAGEAKSHALSKIPPPDSHMTQSLGIQGAGLFR